MEEFTIKKLRKKLKSIESYISYFIQHMVHKHTKHRLNINIITKLARKLNWIIDIYVAK